MSGYFLHKVTIEVRLADNLGVFCETYITEGGDVNFVALDDRLTIGRVESLPMEDEDKHTLVKYFGIDETQNGYIEVNGNSLEDTEYCRAAIDAELSYTQPDGDADSLIDSLSGCYFTTDRKLEETVFLCLPCSLQDSYLEVMFAVDVGVQQPETKDIQGILIVNWAGTVLGGRANLAGSTGAELRVIIDELVEDIAKERLYNVVVERIKGSSSTRKTIEITARHPLQAVSYAFVELVEERVAYGNHFSCDTIDTLVRDCMVENKPINISIERTQYKLLSVGEVGESAE